MLKVLDNPEICKSNVNLLVIQSEAVVVHPKADHSYLQINNHYYMTSFLFFASPQTNVLRVRSTRFVGAAARIYCGKVCAQPARDSLLFWAGVPERSSPGHNKKSRKRPSGHSRRIILPLSTLAPPITAKYVTAAMTHGKTGKDSPSDVGG